MASSRTCLATSDNSFGPRIDPQCRQFDFTLLFEDIFFTCLPAAVFLSLLPSNVTLLCKRPATCSVRSKLLLSKLMILACILITQIVFLTLRLQDVSFQTSASLVADALAMIGIAGAAWLSYLDHQRSLRPSTLLSLYLSVLAILGIARVRTLWLIGLGHRQPAIMTASVVLTGFALLLESIEKKTSLKPDKRSGAPEQYSSFWIRTSYAWLTATFRAGYSKVISLDDLPTLDTQLECRVLRDTLVSTFAKYDHRKRNSLLKACFRSYLPSFLSCVIPRLCITVFTFTQPFLINTTVSYVNEPESDADYGKGLVGAWGLVFVGVAASTAIYNYQVTRFITRIRGGLIGLVYQETLRARTADLGDVTAVTLMSTDVERIVSCFQMVHESWATVLDMSIAIWLLERQVFIACLSPVTIVVIFIIATAQMSSATKLAQRRWIEKVQDRLRATSSMLDDMKAVKMLGLSRVMSTIIQGLRKNEIEKSKVFRKLLIWRLLLSNTPINLAPVATFAVYVIISVYWKNESLLTAQAFTSMALITLLTNPVLTFIQTVPSLIQCIGSFDRIQEYYNYAANMDDTNDTALRRDWNGSSISLQSLALETPDSGQDPRKHVIEVENQGFSWGVTKPAVLKDIDFKVEQSTITMLVGTVGSGKSTLLESILGETKSTSQALRHSSHRIAYCAQQPWLENGTIRSNIIGISPYDRKWYSSVKFACGLEADMQQMEKGDQTMVGSKGVNLSGGQKQRIALARAVYSRRKIVLLDDVFSGMDAHTISTVSRRLLGREGLFRTHHTTVLLATHSHKLMALADTIVALQDGRIIEIGSPRTLLNNNGYVAKLDLNLVNDDDQSNEVINVARIVSTAAASRSSVDLAAEADKSLSDARRKTGDVSVYRYYFKNAGYFPVGMFLGSAALWIFCSEFPTVWLNWWSAANEVSPNANVGMYMGVFAMLSLIGVVAVTVGCWFAFLDLISNSAYQLHRDLLESTLRAPFRFFSTTDNGTLTNRFSQDMELIDMNLPLLLVNYVSAAFSSLAEGIILIVFSQYLAVTLPFLGFILFVLQRFYLQTSRQVRLLEIEAKAPLYTHFGESVSGAATIRAFGWQSHYQDRNCRFVDDSQRPAYLQFCIQHWLAFVLDMTVAAIAVILLAVVTTWKSKFSAGSVGVSLVMVMSFSNTLMRLIKYWTLMESSIGAVSRVKQFVTETEVEEKDGWGRQVAENWPESGKMEFKGLVAAHRPDSEHVLKGISMSIKPKEHVVICGRSGSGKTSLILALLQMIETQGGQILVDDIDVSTLSCMDVRSRLNVVPQDPFLIPGTVRFNIDPFKTASDEEIMHALEGVRLWAIVQEQGGLDNEIDTAAWSAGQRQLLCLARAMIRKSKVLILDEATSSVDTETEAIMQEIIDTSFKDCTVLAVMHRLKHVARYDRVALLDSGSLMEFDSPAALLESESKFAGLYESYGR